MRFTPFWALLLIVISSFSLKGDKQAYQLFNTRGKSTQYAKLLAEAAKADIVMFGELHDNPICHWLEAELMKDLYQLKKENLVLGAEMFEADNQNALDSFLKGQYTDKEFAAAARFWPNYKTDYKPLVLFAKENKLRFIGTNIPRRYASMVFKKGFKALDSLTDLEKSWMAPLPMAYDSTLPGYRDILIATGGHGGPTLPMAQASKDATMAHFILKNYKPGNTIIHYNGSYHSNNYEGIVWYLKQANPALKIVTISTTEQKNVKVLDAESKGVADFILVTPEGMTKTH
jgi:uncharacterized iron-regulated protein